MRALYGHDPLIKWKVAACLAAQLALAWLCADAPWLALLAVAYTIGGVLNHSLSLALHETSHNLAFRAFGANRAFGYVANLAIGVPIFASFKRYHMEHHRYQGEDGIDVDVPTAAGACGGGGRRGGRAQGQTAQHSTAPRVSWYARDRRTAVRPRSRRRGVRCPSAPIPATPLHAPLCPATEQRPPSSGPRPASFCGCSCSPPSTRCGRWSCCPRP